MPRQVIDSVSCLLPSSLHSILPSIQPRLITKESNRKQSIISAEVHLVKVKAAVDVTWKIITLHMSIWRKKILLSLSPLQIKTETTAHFSNQYTPHFDFWILIWILLVSTVFHDLNYLELNIMLCFPVALCVYGCEINNEADF